MNSDTSPSTQPYLPPSRLAVVLGLVGSGHVMSHVYILTLPPLFALIKAELDVSYAALGLMVTMFHVATGIMQVPAGMMVDRFGARIMLVIGMLVSALSISAIGVVDSYVMMVCLTALAGVGNSVFHPADYAILAASVRTKHLGKAFGFHLLAGNLGFAVAPVLLASLAALWDWRSAVIAVGLAGVAVGVAMIVLGRDLRAASAPSADEQGAGGNARPHRLTSPALWVMLAFFVLLALATSGIQTFAPTVLNTLYGLGLGTANTALTAFLSAGFIGVAIGGFVADALRRPVFVVVGCMLLSAVCMAVVGFINLAPVLLLTTMAISGAAVGAMRPARDMMVNAIAPPGTTGKAFGFVGMGLSIGGAVAPVGFGHLVDIGASAWVFALCVLFMFLSVATAVVADRLTTRATDETSAVTSS
jgi:MFS transporter, FSR family, fosmidomycin resistance protein